VNSADGFGIGSEQQGASATPRAHNFAQLGDETRPRDQPQTHLRSGPTNPVPSVAEALTHQSTNFTPGRYAQACSRDQVFQHRRP
jgi:hypothetical protein